MINFEKNIAYLNLDYKILDKLYKLNIESINELWKCNKMFLKENGLNDNEINIIKIKLQLLSIDLNGKIYK